MQLSLLLHFCVDVFVVISPNTFLNSTSGVINWNFRLSLNVCYNRFVHVVRFTHEINWVSIREFRPILTWTYSRDTMTVPGLESSLRCSFQIFNFDPVAIHLRCHLWHSCPLFKIVIAKLLVFFFLMVISTWSIKRFGRVRLMRLWKCPSTSRKLNLGSWTAMIFIKIYYLLIIFEDVPCGVRLERYIRSHSRTWARLCFLRHSWLYTNLLY